MISAAKPVREIACAAPLRPPEAVLTGDVPVVMRGLASSWPLAQAARRSPGDALDYLERFCADCTVTVSQGPPEIKGRLFYDADFSGLNYSMARLPFADVLALLRGYAEDENAPLCYVGSTTIDKCLPGIRAENDIVIPGADPLASIWIGARTRIAAHFDVPDNIAVVAVGRRRFTLFPPDQVENLYFGPLDFTLAGQPVSLVDFQDYDAEKFPRFAEALKHAQAAELEPGDAIFIPSMWRHHIEATAPLNVLVNYWWRASPAYMGNPMDALTHALLSVRDLPPAQREAWRAMFAHYVFDWDGSAAAHIPEKARGPLAPMNEAAARRLRALLLNRLNR